MSTTDSSAVSNQVRVWEEQVEIPTYGTGKPDKNPMFLEKRVYQGSSGRVYPYPVIDKILDEKNPNPTAWPFLKTNTFASKCCPKLADASIAH